MESGGVKKISAQEIPGRGGSAFTYLESTDNGFHVFLLACGASREQQYDDFYKVYVS